MNKIINKVNLSKGYLENAQGWNEDAYGNKYHFVNGYLHSIDDGPAVICADNRMIWYEKGKVHRENGPALIDGFMKEWWFKGERHREDGPAVEYANGDTCWFFNGKAHRDNGPAIKVIGGKNEYCINGFQLYLKDLKKLPRDKDKKLHSLEEIRFKNVNGEDCSCYALHGKILSKEEFEKYILNEEFENKNKRNRKLKI